MEAETPLRELQASRGMRIDQLIKTLTTLAAQHGQDLPVYTECADPWLVEEEGEISGARFRMSEEIEGENGEAIETMPERIFLKV